MKILCTIDRIFDVQFVGQKNTAKRSVLVTEHGRTPSNSMMIDFMGAKADLLNAVCIGQCVEIEYSINYSQRDERVYNNIKGHAITNILT